MISVIPKHPSVPSTYIIGHTAERAENNDTSSYVARKYLKHPLACLQRKRAIITHLHKIISSHPSINKSISRHITN